MHNDLNLFFNRNNFNAGIDALKTLKDMLLL